MKETFGLEATHETARHTIYTAPVAGLGRLVMSWEQHSEFVAYTFFLADEHELHVEEQNQRLLANADRRARLQVELQNAVEGLTVVVITYYALGLVGYVLKGANHLGMRVGVELRWAWERRFCCWRHGV